MSKKYHPDKNKEDTSDKFQRLKKAYEVLGDGDKRLMYDVFGQEDFSSDDRMLDMLAMKFKNKTEQETQFRAYKAGRRSLKIFGEAGPYYLTWLLLTIFRVDRDYSGNILLGLILVVFFFEAQVRLNYGSASFELLIKLMYAYFPESFTVG